MLLCIRFCISWYICKVVLEFDQLVMPSNNSHSSCVTVNKHWFWKGGKQKCTNNAYLQLIQEAVLLSYSIKHDIQLFITNLLQIIFGIQPIIFGDHFIDSVTPNTQSGDLINIFIKTWAVMGMFHVEFPLHKHICTFWYKVVTNTKVCSQVNMLAHRCLYLNRYYCCFPRWHWCGLLSDSDGVSFVSAFSGLQVTQTFLSPRYHVTPISYVDYTSLYSSNPSHCTLITPIFTASNIPVIVCWLHLSLLQ